MFGETGNERILRHVQPKVFLLGQPARGRGRVRDRLAFASAGVIDHDKITLFNLARHVQVNSALFAQDVQRALEVFFSHHRQLAFDGQSFVFRQLKIRRGLERDGELKRPAFGELDFLNVRLADDAQFLVGDGFAIPFGNQLALRFFVDLRRVRFDHQVPRRFAGTKAGQADLLLKIQRNLLERGVHRRRVHFHPQQLLARAQIFDRHIHNHSFRCKSPASVLFGTWRRGAGSVEA